MKIRKVDDKPMVIHTKEKAKIHAHEPKGAKIKGSNIYTVERGPKTAGAKVTDTDRKKSYRKSTIHQSEPKNKGLSRFKQNLKESNTSIKTKNTNLHIAGRTGALVAGAVTDQVEGGQEVSQAAYLAYEASRPVTGTASKGAALFRKKAAAEAKKRIKKVEAGKKLAKKTAKKAAKDTAKTVAKETAKETAKTTAKVATKTATKAAATAAGTAVAPGVGTAIGMAAGYAAGVSIEVKDEKMTNRSRKIKFFLDKMKAQENQTDSVAKLVKDLIVRKAITWVKAAAPIIGLVLLLLVLVVAMIAVPVIAVIAILYNSPFALFLPPLESGDTVQTVTSAYVQEFNRDVNTKVNEHTGYDLGELVYVDYEGMGIYHFDSWAANFGEVTTALELTVEGSGFRFKSRFNKFTNLPELMNIFREVADVQTADMLDLDVPALRGGKPIIVESEPDWYVKQVMEDFVVRAERIRGGGVDPSVDNFLKITHEARLLGTDARLIDKDAPNNPDGKLNKVAENVWKEYEKGNANGHIGCQLIFSDIGTPGTDKDFTIYDYLKETLIQYGIPADEIAFIHDAKTDAQRDALFKEMRTGKKKVLIGSTDKCGTGVNVQTHLVAMHHVDCPWKPSSIEQREGRGIRQGNENEEVAIYRYVTKGTFDAYNWSLVENKQRFISQVMTSKAVSRSCEDIDEATLSYAEIKAVATGNPLIKEKMEIDNDVQRLKLLKASYDNQRYGLQDNFMIKYPKLIKTATEKLANVREDVKARDKELIDNPEFAITIGKATYTERVDGGTMMLEAISKCKTGETTAIGKFHGLELLVEKNFLGINYMVLRGKTEYKAELSTSPVGSMVKLENLFNGLHENIDFLEKKIEQYQNDLEASKAQYDKPFAYSEELNEKMARQCELNAQLDLENAKAVDADLSGPEEEREADDRMESAAIVAEDKGAYQADREGRTR